METAATTASSAECSVGQTAPTGVGARSVGIQMARRASQALATSKSLSGFHKINVSLILSLCTWAPLLFLSFHYFLL